MHQSFGGVGRNIADCLSRLGSNPLFVSVLGDDVHASVFISTNKHMVVGRIISLNFGEFSFSLILMFNIQYLANILKRMI